LSPGITTTGSQPEPHNITNDTHDRFDEKERKVTGAFTTQTAQMQQAASKVDDVNTEVRSQLSSLQSQVEAVQAHWTGQAASTFQALMLRYNEDAQKLSQALTDISEQIRTSGQTYAAQDEAANDSVKTAGSGLNL
jgi:WXG100 family type VII secretion target